MSEDGQDPNELVPSRGGMFAAVAVFLAVGGLAETEQEPGTVSRNISLVLDNLLRNYKSGELPSSGEDGPTIVRTNMLIRSMGPISELDMDYSMDCYFRQSWRDSRLSFAGPIKSLSLSIKMLERIWRPDTYFHNGKQSYLHTITVPNKLLRISQEGDILYSMRLTVKAKCPMELRNFPMDSQSCPLVLGSYAHTTKSLVYEWQSGESVSFVPGMMLSQFDLMGSPLGNGTVMKRREEYSVLRVNFNLQRNTGYFVIHVYLPCILIVVLSWVSFWIQREATSDRVGLGITTVLTMSTLSLDSRTDLPRVGYATALDWFLLMSFLYCVATLLEFAGVHYFTKVGSGDTVIDEDEWEDMFHERGHERSRRTKHNRQICPIYNKSVRGERTGENGGGAKAGRRRNTIEMETQTETRVSQCRELLLCLAGDDEFRKRRQFEAAANSRGTDLNSHVNSVSLIDKTARIVFPMSFALLNLLYWSFYLYIDHREMP